MSKTIPNQVSKIAVREGCNHIEFVGAYKGREVYSVSSVDEDSFPVPTGLPMLVLWNGERTEVISGSESLNILSHF